MIQPKVQTSPSRTSPPQRAANLAPVSGVQRDGAQSRRAVLVLSAAWLRPWCPLPSLPAMPFEMFSLSTGATARTGLTAPTCAMFVLLALLTAWRSGIAKVQARLERSVATGIGFVESGCTLSSRGGQHSPSPPTGRRYSTPLVWCRGKSKTPQDRIGDATEE